MNTYLGKDIQTPTPDSVLFDGNRQYVVVGQDWLRSIILWARNGILFESFFVLSGHLTC